MRRPRAKSRRTQEAGVAIGDPVAAADPDHGDTLTYTLDVLSDLLFSVDNEGQIVVDAGVTLDYETTKSYTVTVSVSDGKDADGNSDAATDDTITVTIDVTDVNEAPEFASETAMGSIAENTAVGGNVGASITATDPDDGDTLTYTLDTTSAATFDIDGVGQLQTKVALDHDTTPSYTVTVSVRDSKDANGDADSAPDDTITVTITVTDVNAAPEYAGGTDTRSIDENTAAGEDIGAPVAATDDDDATLVYILGGTDARFFTIVEGTGQLQTKAALNHETKDSYTVTVSVRDNKNAVGGADTTTDATITVTITVTDVNEKPQFASETGRRSIAGEHRWRWGCRRANHGYGPGRWRRADLHPWRDRCRVLHYRRRDGPDSARCWDHAELWGHAQLHRDGNRHGLVRPL